MSVYDMIVIWASGWITVKKTRKIGNLRWKIADLTYDRPPFSM